MDASRWRVNSDKSSPRMCSAIPLTFHAGHSVDRCQSSADMPRSSSSNAVRSGRSNGVISTEGALADIEANHNGWQSDKNGRTCAKNSRGDVSGSGVNEYEDLFADAPPRARRGESTPLYLYDRAAHLRIAELVPEVQMIVVLRDPVDRAYSNWMHAWSDGLEPVDDFLTTCKFEDERVAAGWAPFWHYRRLGLYASQLEHLFRIFRRDQVHILRYKARRTPIDTLNAICAFLGIEQNLLGLVPPENSRNFAAPSLRNHALAWVMRAGAGAGRTSHRKSGAS